PDTIVPLENTPAGRAITTGLPCLARGSELDRYPSEAVNILRAEGVQAVCCVPLIHRDRTFGTLNLASRRIDTFTPADVELLQPFGAQIAIAAENTIALKELDTLKDKLAVKTLYLDEAGDIPLELQPKLLRVLQEQEFERLGGNRTQRVDVRVVAATNVDLSKLVAQRAFRNDLYYRLNVFPIQIPALRERFEDIPL